MIAVAMTRRVLFLAAVIAVAAVRPLVAAENPVSFPTWLQGVRAEARAAGLQASFLDAALAGLRPIDRVIELDRRQPEFTLTFWNYLDKSVNDTRIRRGRRLLAEHGALLDRTARRYGVQPRFIVAFWGLESNFGRHTGAFPVVGAVATLAHDTRRSGFFRAQLMAALTIMSRGDVAVDANGSWAGAMGNFQFIPTTYRDFAVDADGDGRRDLWGSLPDMFASAANYLSRSGWRRNWSWGREVRLPRDFDLALAGLGVRRPIADWAKRGVTKADGRPLPDDDAPASVVLPAGYQGPAFLVYRNFHAILTWNRSILYAVAVGHLADRLVGGGPFRTPRPATEVPLARRDVMELQRLLAAKGFDAGGSDGVIGPKTRDAIRAYQKGADLPADGYASFGLLERLRGRGG